VSSPRVVEARASLRGGGDSPPLVREVGGTLSHDIRGAAVVWRREMIRVVRDPIRVVTQVVQPVLYLFVLGTGLSALTSHRGFGRINFRTFMYPGILSMTVLFTSVFSAMSIVWDREFGFLREMLVSPVRRWALIVGKCLGGATVATFQGILILLLAGAAQVPYDPVMLATLVGEMVLVAVALNGMAILIASRIKQMQAFQWVMTFAVMPMFFLSGAIYPLSGLPGWLVVLTHLDPVAYAVDPLRRAVFANLDLGQRAMSVLNPGLSWDGWRLPTGVELGVMALFAAATLGAAVYQFSKPE